MNPLRLVGSICGRSRLLERAVCALGHRAPESRAVKSLCYHTGVSAVGANPGKTERVACTAEGLKVIVPLDEPPLRGLYFHGTYEADVTALMKRLAKPAQTWLDIGANVGVYTVLLGKLVGPSGRVIAFEPNPVMNGMITRSVALNGLRNVAVVGDAVSDRSGETVTLFVPTGEHANSGQASVIKHRDVNAVREVAVGTVALDDYLDREGVRPDFVKIDIEGLEILAFRGMKRTLTDAPPACIIAELTQFPDALAQPLELIAHLAQYNYRPFRLGAAGLIPHGLEEPVDVSDFNFAFFHESARRLAETLTA